MTTRFADHLLQGTHASRPAATAVPAGTLYACTDHDLIYQSDGATWSTWATVGGGGGGDVATDVIWDAAGDIAVGTGANTAAKLALGAAGKVLRSSGSALAYEYPVGYELDYVQITSNVTISATTEAGSDTVITGSAIAYDGSTRVCIEFFSPLVDARQFVVVSLWDGSSELGWFGQWEGNNATTMGPPMLCRRFLTPSAATHTYSVRAYRGATAATVFAGAGGTATTLPAYLRITKA